MEGVDPPIPPARIRIAGRALSAVIVRAPWIWPLLRAPTRAFFDRSAAGWDERVGSRTPRHLAPLAAATARIDAKPERILEIGTGTGECALFLAREYLSASVRGIDISAEMIRSARRKIGLDPQGRVAFRVADAAALPWPEDSFDLVAQVNVPLFFDEIARVLRPGGFVIVAATLGSATPFYTPRQVLERGLRRRGITVVEVGEIEAGTFLVGRMSG
jgi:SAM-dependent methyltransferase